MNNELADLRKKIDLIDDQILDLLKERVGKVEEIGRLKKQLNLPIRDSGREKEKIRLLEEKARKLNLPHQLITQLWNLLFLESEKIEK